MADTLLANQSLAPGQFLQSQNGSFQLVYQADGNLVVYRIANGQPIWESKSEIAPPGVAIMQSDGNFVLCKAAGADPYWATGTNRPGSLLKLVDDGTVVVNDDTGDTVWSSGRLYPGQLQVGGSLRPGETLSSPTGEYTLVYQNDGNLVLYRSADGFAVWDTKTTGKATGFVLMQWDGNFVVYGPGGDEAWWASGSNSCGSAVVVQDDGSLAVVVQDDGNLVLYDSGVSASTSFTLPATGGNQSVTSSAGGSLTVSQPDYKGRGAVPE
jgi:hypothetical protein